MIFAKVWQWINDNLTITTFGEWVIAIFAGCWGVFTYFHKNGKQTNSHDGYKLTNIEHNGSGDMQNHTGTGNNLIINRDPQDRDTIERLNDTNKNLNAALKYYQDLLKSKEIDEQQQKEQINELRSALELTQSIAQGGGELASAAQALLDTFITAPDDPTLPEQFDNLTKRYENGPVRDLIKLYLGRGAVSYYSDTQGALAAYTRVTELDRSHMDGHNQRGHLLNRLGNLAAAQQAFERVLYLADANNDLGNQAVALGNLGTVAQTRGDLDDAEQLSTKALELNKELEDKEGMASNYGNLGIVARTRGDLDDAEQFYTQALELYKELEDKKGMAISYGNLGVVARTRGDLDAAQQLYNQALELNKELGHKQGMAANYGNLGIVAYIRGDLDAAEELYNQALELNKELGYKQGMAENYGNLGVVAESRGDLDVPEQLHTQSLELNKELGRKKGMANNYSRLSIVAKKRGDLDAAEQFHNQALELEKELGRKQER